ncbi:hypothetical protein K7X08_022725 [Anisodus acutangulus]|uniref:B box-type domain-containing protein n=1 Tax=Anisodus acutangulus TaxID=402998 RepID=A0A9Q1RHE8_9SOLA|nr:hypothetical protein K7X08_022725 [Anisodus acutangulus]
MYCESDQASLCFNCDSQVHCANFLVAKHSRNLLCHTCQSPTPWAASGPKLNPTLSFCNSCIDNPAAAQLRNPNGERVEENYQTETDNDNDNDEDEYDDSSDSEIDEEGDDDDGNQVVPLSSTSSPSPARSVSSSGSYEGISAAGYGGGAMVAVCSSSPWKRSRGSDCLPSEDEETCSSSLNCQGLLEENKGPSSSIGFSRPTKMLRTNELCE